MKSALASMYETYGVASFAEAWIEMVYETMESSFDPVASFAEAWIEITIRNQENDNGLSSPP